MPIVIQALSYEDISKWLVKDGVKDFSRKNTEIGEFFKSFEGFVDSSEKREWVEYIPLKKN